MDIKSAYGLTARFGMSVFALLSIGDDYAQWFNFESKAAFNQAQLQTWTPILNWLEEPLRTKVARQEVPVRVTALTPEWAPIAKTILFVSGR